MRLVAVSVLRAELRPRRFARTAVWLFGLVSACSVYDESLLVKRDPVATTGGASNAGEGGEGATVSGGGPGNGGSGGGAGNTSGGGVGGLGAGAGGVTGGAGGGGGANSGGVSSGGLATGGSLDAGAGGEAGDVGTGGTSGGASGGKGGTTSGGATNGGTTSGGATSGGATSGGTTSGGTTSGGTAGKGGSGGSGGSNCAGKLSGGICWYLGALNESCEQTCSSHDSVNGAMAAFVGTPVQGGSLAECRTLANLFFASVSVYDGVRDDGLGLGCHFYPPDVYWLTEPDFTEDAAEVGAQLICGCNR